MACSSPLKAAYDDITSPKSFARRKWEKSWFVCQREELQYKQHVRSCRKPDATKAVQIKCNNNLSSFQLHFIANFVLTELASSNLFTPEGVGCICAFWQGSLSCDVCMCQGQRPKNSTTIWLQLCTAITHVIEVFKILPVICYWNWNYLRLLIPML